MSRFSVGLWKYRSAGPIWTSDFTTLSLGSGIALPNSLLISRASDGHSVQTSSSTVQLLSAGNDTARVGQRTNDTSSRGMILESAKTNNFLDSRQLNAASYTPGIATLTQNAANGPDGSLLSDRVNASSAQYSPYQTPVLTTAKHTFSMWARANSGTSQHQIQHYNGTAYAESLLIDTTWTRRAVSRASSASTALIPVDARDWSAAGGIVATAMDVIIDMIQVELCAFPTEWIATSASPVTRAGERLYLTDRTNLIRSGRLSLEIVCIPKGAAHEYSSAMRIWTIDGSNYCEISSTTQLLTVVIGGTSHTFPVALGWNRYDKLELFVEAGGGSEVSKAYYRVTPNGGSAGTTIFLGESASAQSSISSSGSIDLLCNGTSNQLDCWVQSIKAYS